MTAQDFTFVANTVAAYAFTGTIVEPTSPFTRTVANGSDWEVDDVVAYRLKYIGAASKIYRISSRFQQTSATAAFRPELSLFATFPVVSGNGTTNLIVNGSVGSLGPWDAYNGGFYFIATPNTVYGMGLRDRTAAAPGNSINWILTVFMNELR
jgi:hypothetical protein